MRNPARCHVADLVVPEELLLGRLHGCFVALQFDQDLLHAQQVLLGRRVQAVRGQATQQLQPSTQPD